MLHCKAQYTTGNHRNFAPFSSPSTPARPKPVQTAQTATTLHLQQHPSKTSHRLRSTRKDEQSTRLPAQQFSAAALAATQACAAVLAGQLALTDASWAVLNSPNAKIPRTADAALRRSIPAFNRDVEKIQRTLEEIAFLLRIPQRKPWGNMASDVQSALASFEIKEVLLGGVPDAQTAEAEELLSDLYSRLKQLELAVKTQQPDFAGVRVADCLKRVADLELLQAPGLSFIIPKEYAALPHLDGRAIVELIVEKADGSLSFVDSKIGGLSSKARVLITVDGYSAPISAGNFIVNVINGVYNGRPVQASYASVITSGDLKTPHAPIPLENLPAGTFDPLYRLPLDVQSGELPVLPLSIAGAVSMTHLPDTESFLSGDEWFVFKFDKQQAGLSGLSFDEGTFGVFGYVTEGMPIITKLETGDVILSAKVVSGLDRLVLPADTANNSSGSNSSGGCSNSSA